MERESVPAPCYCLPTFSAMADMTHPSRQIQQAVSFLFLLFSLLAMTACQRAGAEANTPIAEKEAQALQIAADYARDGDLERAQARLHALDVPNPEQWLALLTERYIAEGADEDAADHLVQLSAALGMRTVAMERYMRARATPTPQRVLELTPTPTSTPLMPTSTPTPTYTPTLTPTPRPRAVVQADVLNVRAGPSTDYPVVGRLNAGETVDIIGRNEGDTWWQIRYANAKRGWVYGPLVEAQGMVNVVPVIVDIPPPPPTPTPLPPTPTPVPQPQVDFRVVSIRLLSIQENGGCVGMHNIFVTVLDAAGAPLDGIRVGRVWVPEDVKVTGADNKGPGKAVFDLFKHGDQVRVLDYTSETTRPLEVEDEKIPIPELIAAGYCPNETECRRLINENRLCRYHYSWEVVFQRTW